MTNKDLAHVLYNMQETKNSGRGVSAVREIVRWLKSDDFDSAKTVAETDWDKIRAYPDIALVIETNLLGDK